MYSQLSRLPHDQKPLASCNTTFRTLKQVLLLSDYVCTDIANVVLCLHAATCPEETGAAIPDISHSDHNHQTVSGQRRQITSRPSIQPALMVFSSPLKTETVVRTAQRSIRSFFFADITCSLITMCSLIFDVTVRVRVVCLVPRLSLAARLVPLAVRDTLPVYSLAQNCTQPRSYYRAKQECCLTSVSLLIGGGGCVRRTHSSLPPHPLVLP